MDKLLQFSDDFTIYCGTVPIDFDKRLILLLYHPRKKGAYILPQAIENVGETLEATAIRGTLEDSGYECRLQKHQLETNAQGLKEPSHTEPICVQQRFKLGSGKIVFWFLSDVDSSSQPMQKLQEDGEVKWLSPKEAVSKCSYDGDRKVVQGGLQAAAASLLQSTP